MWRKDKSMGQGNSKSDGPAYDPDGFWIRPGDNFMVLGKQGDKTWAIPNPTVSPAGLGNEDKAELSQVSLRGNVEKPLNVRDYVLQYSPSCSAGSADSPNKEALMATESGNVTKETSSIIQYGEFALKPWARKGDGDKLRWLKRSVAQEQSCDPNFRRFAFVPNSGAYPTGVPLIGGEDVNIRVYKSGSDKAWALRTPRHTHDAPELDMTDQVSSWKLYRTSGWVLERGKCRPWSIEEGRVPTRDQPPPYKCGTPEKGGDGVWRTSCRTEDQNLLFSSEDACQRFKAKDKNSNGGEPTGPNNNNDSAPNNGGEPNRPNNNNDGPNNGGEPNRPNNNDSGPNNGGEPNDDGGPNNGGDPVTPVDPPPNDTKNKKPDNTVVYIVVGGVILLLLIVLLFAVSGRA